MKYPLICCTRSCIPKSIVLSVTYSLIFPNKTLFSHPSTVKLDVNFIGMANNRLTESFTINCNRHRAERLQPSTDGIINCHRNPRSEVAGIEGRGVNTISPLPAAPSLVTSGL